ncbi:hypothetical protein JF546_02645 [Nitratireductor aquimarinus]|uniref:hypothetical protein n=1 Tax=Nitratireductor aquimarinus TaxID=889300 RepID=UPI001A8D3543|nr:hypothetical protein [Nitratireductor aquimarinus]MBN8241907.1 hypothetical protein [Nitratireductor aquimarinus]MBY6130293.1 hypothetical protein [Nitratireductor aquimarinus]MCA1305078.1 hypothetical protein [Nitratireductor aquimarinus]
MEIEPPKFDRALQKKILEDLKTLYPEFADMQRSFKEIPTDRELTPNLRYLEEFGLVEVNWYPKTNTSPKRPFAAAITARGIDFLADDGGLTAILGVVTVRLHEETIKELLIDRVQSSDEPESVKSRMVSQIKSLPAEMTKTVTIEGLKAGLARTPDAIAWLQKLLDP